MAFAVAASPFLLYAIAHLICIVFESKRLTVGFHEGHSWTWTASRVLLLIGLVSVMLDCLRLFAGGFWHVAHNGSKPPFGVGVYIPCCFAHLVMVPLFISVQAELYLAAVMQAETNQRRARGFRGFALTVMSSRHSLLTKCLRASALILSLSLSALESVNFVGRAAAYADMGYQTRDTASVVQYTFPSLETAEAHGYPTVANELQGVVMFAVAAVVAGGNIWFQLGWKAYFVTSLIGMLGQALSPIFGMEFFFFASNFFEIFSFAGMVMADFRLLNLPVAPEKNNSDSAGVELEISESFR